ncbi:MAG: NAD(P)H-binding protein [Chloroflexota bacterium]
MTRHRLVSSQVIPRPRDEVFPFFAQPANLARITPPDLGFRILTQDAGMREGLEVGYRVRPLLGIPLTWRTRIERYQPPEGFVDVQAAGPYRSWEHRHTFHEQPEGTLVEDEVTYELPLGRLGDLAHGPLVRPRLEGIFRHRARVVADILAAVRPNPSPMTVAVAGGTGFVGGGIAAECHARGHRVVVLSHRADASHGPLPDAVELRQADVATSDGLAQTLEGVDALVIALAFPNLPIESPRRGRTFMEVDAAGTERLVSAARQAGVRRIVYISGAGAAPDATRHWFRAKWRAEEAVRGAGPTWTIIRPTWVYGPRDRSLNRFVGFARRLPVVPMTNRGRQLLAPVFVDDVARLAADSLVDPAAADQVFELGGPETLPMRDIIATALRVAQLRRPIVPGPAPLLRLGALPLTLLPSPPLTPDAIDFINQPATVDLGPLQARMPRTLTPLEEGLRSYLAPDSGPATISFETLS